MGSPGVFWGEGIVLAMVKNRYFILTGAFGSGKSTLLERLQLRGIGESLNRHDRYWPNSEAFRETDSPKGIPALCRTDALENAEYLWANRYVTRADSPRPRNTGSLGYAKLFGFDFSPGENAAKLYRYNPQDLSPRHGRKYIVQITNAPYHFLWPANLVTIFE